jgi:hypothetical protein
MTGNGAGMSSSIRDTGGKPAKDGERNKKPPDFFLILGGLQHVKN